MFIVADLVSLTVYIVLICCFVSLYLYEIKFKLRRILIMPPASKKLRGILLSACLSFSPSFIHNFE